MTDPFNTKLTRVRVEGTGQSVDHLRLVLTEAVAKIHEDYGGFWIADSVPHRADSSGDPSIDLQTTKEGYWGRITVTRHDRPQ